MIDGFYLLFLLTLIFTLVVQFKVTSTFNKYARVRAGMGQTAAAVARRILDAHGLFDVKIERVHGSLTDHYDPRSKVLRLSDSVYSSPSASAIGVAAHEVGHAIQHAENYAPIVLRGKLVPVVNVASKFSWIAIMLGLFFSYSSIFLGDYMIMVGILLFASTTLFHLVTLPCELNASRRAMTELEVLGWYSQVELRMSREVLRAAAMTYVASLAMSFIQLLRLIRIFGNRRD